jgi:hypothetical protein
MKRIALLAAVMLTACHASTDGRAVAELAPGVVLDAAQSAAVKRLRQACPGLDGYFPDLRITAVESSIVSVEIPNNPANVPDALQAWGNACQYETAGEHIATSKLACASVCAQRQHTGDGAPYLLN